MSRCVLRCATVCLCNACVLFFDLLLSLCQERKNCVIDSSLSFDDTTDTTTPMIIYASTKKGAFVLWSRKACTFLLVLLMDMSGHQTNAEIMNVFSFIHTAGTAMTIEDAHSKLPIYLWLLTMFLLFQNVNKNHCITVG